MNQHTSQPVGEWNYKVALICLLGGIILQSIALPCPCYKGIVNMYIAGAVNLLVILRLIIARVIRERGRGWIFYVILPSLIVPVVLLIEHFYLAK